MEYMIALLCFVFDSYEPPFLLTYSLEVEEYLSWHRKSEVTKLLIESHVKHSTHLISVKTKPPPTNTEVLNRAGLRR